MTWTDAGMRDGWGTRVAGVGTRVGTSVPTSVGAEAMATMVLGRDRQAAELASEAARAEGASHPRHRPWPARHGPGQAVKDEWLRRPSLRGGGLPDIRP
jgi:hypothetical protein